MSRNTRIAILCGLVLAAAITPAASSAGESHHVVVSLGGDRVFEGTGAFTSATTLVVRGSGVDFGSWSKADGLQVTVTPQGGSGEVVTYNFVAGWPSAESKCCYSKTLTFTLSTTNP